VVFFAIDCQDRDVPAWVASLSPLGPPGLSHAPATGVKV
jgi:hypothetical protein